MIGQTEAPVAYDVGVALALLSSVCPPQLHVGGLPDGDLHGNLYVMVVGRQGADRKSTALKYGSKLLADAVPGRRGERPGSPQGLAKGLSKNQQQILVYSDLADLFAMTQRRQGGNILTGIKAKFLEAFDCEPVESQLSRSLVRAPEPRLTILGGVNRPILDTYVDPEDWETGFMSRFLVIYAHVERSVKRAHMQPQVREWLRRWLGICSRYAKQPQLWGSCLGLDAGAHDLLDAFEHAVRSTAPTGGTLRAVGPRARIRVQAIKTALLLGLSSEYGWPQGGGQRGYDWLIDARLMSAAIKIALIGFAGSLAIAVTATASPDMRMRRDVLSAIGEDWTGLGRILRDAQVLKRRSRDVLNTLKEEGIIEEEIDTHSAKAYYRRTTKEDQSSGVAEAARSVKEISTAYRKALNEGIPINGVPHVRQDVMLPALPLVDDEDEWQTDDVAPEAGEWVENPTLDLTL